MLLAEPIGRGLRLPSFGWLFRANQANRSHPAPGLPRNQDRETSPLSRHWPTVALVGAVLGATLLYGSKVGGEYDAFVDRFGSPADIVARSMGFEIDTITISGLDQLSRTEVLDASGVSDRNSLLFLNAADLRDRLKGVPLVRDVAVRKLFPNSLILDFTERKAAALWQKSGQLSVVAADGVAIDKVHDARFNALPFIVGPDANNHLREFTDLLDGAGDLRDRIKAGIYVGERRWTLQMDSGVELLLPDADARSVLANFAGVERTARLIDKDVLSVDLRIPGRVTLRLSEEAAAARTAMLAKRPKKVSKE